MSRQKTDTGERQSALGKIIAQMIAVDGPMPVDRYMALALGHESHGYYMGRDPFGRAGDFITAPEVSQMFGELIGIWCAAGWQMMDAPAEWNLIELGAGQGHIAGRPGSRVFGDARLARRHEDPPGGNVAGVEDYTG